MANAIHLAHLQDLIDEARINPSFNLAAELAEFTAAITDGASA